jgi:hypothetical protein
MEMAKLEAPLLEEVGRQQHCLLDQEQGHPSGETTLARCPTLLRLPWCNKKKKAPFEMMFRSNVMIIKNDRSALLMPSSSTTTTYFFLVVSVPLSSVVPVVLPVVIAAVPVVVVVPP